MERKGIILAGGSGTRLYPATKAISKQLLPIFDKPMIYYALSTIMYCNIREVLVITTPHDKRLFEALLGDGKQWGLKLEYEVQPTPGGLAEALIIGEQFLDGMPSALALGDNIFHGESLQHKLELASSDLAGATVFAYHVNNPNRYGVVAFDSSGNVTSIEEKPKNPKSNYAVTGLYFYDEHAPSFAKTLSPSERRELEITDLNDIYLKKGQLKVELMGRGYAWLDTGTPDSLLQAHQLVYTIEQRQGQKIACPEEIAFRKGWIDRRDLLAISESLGNNHYGQYLSTLAREFANGN